MKMRKNPVNSLLALQDGSSPPAGRGMLRIWRIMVVICTLGIMGNTSPVSGGGPEDALSESAYAMESLSLRKEISLEQYEELNRNTTSRISGVDIRNIVVDGDQGRADVIFRIEIKQGASAFSIVAPKRTDQWERIEGKWYKKYYPTEILSPIKQMAVPQGG
jgi:hypothetical protein